MALVSMPFAFLETPSIGLSLLRGRLAEHRIEARIHYLTLDFARRIGRGPYEAIATKPGMSFLAGEWLFSSEALGRAQDEDAYVDAIRRGDLGSVSEKYDFEVFLEQLRDARKAIGEFLDDWADRLVAQRPAIVGFTSVFQQHLASVALGRRIKERDPRVVTLLGGPNCDDVLGVETARRFPFIDGVVYGEADDVIVELAHRVLTGEPIDSVDGVYSSEKAWNELAPAGECISTAPVKDLDGLPVPRYDDFLTQLDEADLHNVVRPELLLETSRGCWWGEKHHCVFCGLNDVTMVYRHKSADRVLDELSYMQALAPHARITGTDAIFNLKYFHDLIPALAERKNTAEVYFETKANLRDDHVRDFYRAGIRTLQPGIESFITQVLKGMDKGVTAAQNVRLLRSCEEHGVLPLWNHLWGLPGEDPDDYAALANKIPRLTHLQPPGWMGPIALLRFSPLQMYPEKFGIQNLRHAAVYDYLYATLPDEAKDNLAYYFDGDFANQDRISEYTASVAEEIRVWRQSHYSSILFWEDYEHVIHLWDTRAVASSPFVELRDAERAVFLALREPALPGRVVDDVGEIYGTAAATDAVERLDELGLLFVDGERCLNVAVAVSRYAAESATPQVTFIRGEKLKLWRRVRELTTGTTAVADSESEVVAIA
ncbi:MAG: RiPP maturation radical SAM C-methyltransferase [Actinomycetota bacterium]|nr:RiPP maturation radical SAM C-methyltransferase [Actinomycetota bacterium]